MAGDAIRPDCVACRLCWGVGTGPVSLLSCAADCQRAGVVMGKTVDKKHGRGDRGRGYGWRRGGGEQSGRTVVQAAEGEETPSRFVP